MKVNRFDEGFEASDDWGDRGTAADSRANPSPLASGSSEPRSSSRSEPDVGYADDREPDYLPDEDPDDREPDPDPDELWPRTEDDLEESPAVAAALPLQALSGPLGAPEKADQGFGQAGQRKTKRFFIKGPVDRDWMVRVLRLKKSAIAVGISLWYRAGLQKDDFFRARRAESAPIRVDRRLKTQFAITPSVCSRGIAALEVAGLIRIVKGGPGRCPVVVLVNLQP